MRPILQSLILKRFRSIPVETVTFDNPTFWSAATGPARATSATPSTSSPSDVGIPPSSFAD